MKIKNHRLADVPYREAHAFGGEIKPTLIVVHDTAGRLNPGSSVEWFCSDECPTSAHVVIERDGSITQQVPFNRKAFHAGTSEWKGKPFCNSFSIGIEIVNPGRLDAAGRAWFHKKTERGFPVAGLKRAKTSAHKDGWWMDYTAEQIEAVTNLCKALVGAYPDIQDVTAHYVISPGRKEDVNPLFPLDAVRSAALRIKGEEEIAELEAVQPAMAAAVGVTAKEIKEQGSRSMGWLDWLWKVLGITSVSSAGAVAADLGGMFKGTINGIKSVAADHAAVLVVAGVVVGFALAGAAFMARQRLVDAARDGRYDPRKDGETA